MSGIVVGLILIGVGAGWAAGRTYQEFGETYLINHRPALQGVVLIMLGFALIMLS